MNNDLAKSLTELIDETLAELEDLRKSRFEAEEIDMGSDANGEMKKEEEKEEEKEEDKKDMEKKEHKEGLPMAHKAEEKEEEKEEESDEDEMKKAEEECAKAEKLHKEWMAKRDKLAEKMKMKKGEGVNKEAEMKKSEPEVKTEIEALKKTFETKLAEIADTVKKLADQPVPAKGVSYRDIQPLAKGAFEGEALSKTKVLEGLVTLKKSGKEVSTEDVLRAELGGQGDLQEIASKYSIK